MPDDHSAPTDIDQLIADVAESADAFIRGDMQRYLELIVAAEDYTLMSPTGGATIRGFEFSDEWIAENQAFFRGDGATLEIEQTYASGDLAVLVLVERQHGEVGDHAPQDWSLRVTLVFRREGDGWTLVHRHADGLVHPISFDHLAALCRGDVDTPAGGDAADPERGPA